MQLDNIGKWLVIAGVILAALGGLMLLAARVPFLSQLGRLPGDIRFQSADGRISCFVPIVSSILLSLLLTIILNIVVRLLNR